MFFLIFDFSRILKMEFKNPYKMVIFENVKTHDIKILKILKIFTFI